MAALLADRLGARPDNLEVRCEPSDRAIGDLLLNHADDQTDLVVGLARWIHTEVFVGELVGCGNSDVTCELRMAVGGLGTVARC
jgi:hypothetical protein